MNPAFSFAVFQFLLIKAALRLEFHAMAGMEPFTEGLEISAYRGKTSNEIFEILAETIWNTESKLLPEELPTLRGAAAIVQPANQWLGSYYPNDKNGFECCLMADYHANSDQIYQLSRRHLALVPKKIMIITDTLQPFENEDLMKAVFASAMKRAEMP